LQVTAAGGFWLRLEGKHDSTFFCQGSESDTLIFRDGLVLRETASQTGVITLTRMKGPAKALRDLADALSENRIGFAAGDCAVDAAQPNASVELNLTWFGKPGRVHSIAVTSPGGEPCPPGTNAIFAAIEGLLAAASTAPGAEQVETSFDPGPPCGGAAAPSLSCGAHRGWR
jgi:hypothetical protein